MSTQMSSACDDHETKRAHTAGRGWSATFPDDLLAVIYSMVASPLGRTRFAAVCRSWRAAALAVPPLPALPWLLLSPRDGSGTEALYCPDDCAVLRLRVPQEDAGKWIIGGHDGGWVAFHTPCLVKIINVFSGAEVGLSTIVCPSRHHALGHLVFISRVVFSAPPNSPQCILAAVTYNCGIALCRLASPNNNGWTVQGCPNNRRFVDITFCNGELYGLNGKRKIVKFEIGVDDDGCPLVTAEHRLVMPRIDREIRMDNVNASYIFDLNGKLAMALKTRWLPNIQPFFKVFQLIDSTGKQQARYKHKWLEVTSLGDQTLFLGKLFSKVVHVPANICSSVERNHIYYSQYCLLGENSIIASDRVVLKISNDISGMICYKEDDSKISSTANDIKRIMSVGYFVQGYLHGGMWILPPDI